MSERVLPRQAGSIDGETSDADGSSAGSDFEGEDLVVGYGGEPVIDGESVAVPAGEVTALVGPNGSGKSTLLKALADQISPEEGVVRVDGREVRDMGSKELARKVGLLSQENTAPGTLTVEDLVAHGRYPHRGAFESVSADDVAAVDRAISLAGIEDLRDAEVGSLSGGQKQLAWIAMALAQETDVLLLDEPTTFLDLHHQLEVMEIVETLRDEGDTTVVLVLHDISQAARHADHVLALKDGEILARGPPDEVVTEELLREVFRVEATVNYCMNGPRIVPRSAYHDDE